MLHKNSSFQVFLCVVFAIGVRSQSDVSIPSDIPSCNRSDPNLNDCLQNVVKEWTLRFRDGIESLNVKPTDPLKIGRANFVYDNGLVKGVIALKKIRLVGLSGLEVRNVSVVLNGTYAKVYQEQFIPKIHITGFYRGEVDAVGIHFKPDGYIDITIYNTTMFTEYLVKSTDRENGYTYVQIETMKNKVNTDLMRTNITGVSPDQTTNDSVVEFVNTNWRQIFDILIEDTLDVFTPYIIMRFNKFLDQVPLIRT